MSERKFNTYMKRHLLKENVGGAVENEFENWLDEMSLKFDDEKITLQTVIDYAQDTLQDYGMDDWQPGQPLPENKKSVKENIETLLSPEDLKYYRAHRDEIEDILNAEFRSSKLSAKDAVEKHKAMKEGSCGYNTDAKTGKKLNTPGGLEERIKSYNFYRGQFIKVRFAECFKIENMIM